ncbi:Calcium-binding protein 39-like [Holothuria leucospilota]|uniref:Calcium-binding protein 39-like n=1 Tax=Holothuria leucospilota TaxID=206669 RepID=A0A9Q1BL79_HOLLE|nr:Calcium-binding protein 39-like [Holothuria leucospilota]
MRVILCGSRDQEPQAEQMSTLAQEFYHFNLFLQVVNNLRILDSEAVEDVLEIFKSLLKRAIGPRTPTLDYISNKTEVLFILLKGYENHEVALKSGLLLRECIRYEPLAKIILKPPQFYDFFTYLEMPTHEIVSDVFSTFKDLLTRHKALCSCFLEENYQQFFSRYKGLMDSSNGFIKKQSVKLLGELLLNRHNFVMMTRYINNPENLKLVMNLLRDKDDEVQFEAFHVFKIFVANPNKAQAIFDVLEKDKNKLLDLINQFHTHRTEDEQFNDEKNYLIAQIQEL